VAVVAILFSALPAHPQSSAADTFQELTELFVQETFNNQPFPVAIEKPVAKRGHHIYRLTYPSPIKTAHEPNNTIYADYYLPNGITSDSPAHPAVICLHILNSNYELVRMLCTSLAQRGIPAIMFKLPYYGERALPGGRDELAQNGQLFAEALQQGIQDSRRTFDVLAALPQIDSKHIGIAGISLGSFVSASTAGSDSRFDRTALLLSGGDLLSIVHQSHETDSLSKRIKALPEDEQLAIQKAILAVDPLTHAAGLRDRAQAGRVLMINGDQDKVVPPAATKKLAKALGISDQVFWLEGLGHYTAVARLPEIMRRTVDFFAVNLPPDTLPPTIDSNFSQDPIARLAKLISRSAAFFTIPPSEGHCHLLDIGIEVTAENGETYAGTIQFARGPEHRFRLQVDAPKIGKAFFGQNEHLWMATDKAVMLGSTPGNVENRNPLAFVDAKLLEKAKMVVGIMSTVALAPSLLEEYVRAEARTSDKTLILDISPRKESVQGEVQITYQPDQKTPQSISFDLQGTHGTLTIRSWQLNSVSFPTVFEPPQDLPVEKAVNADLLRILASQLNIALKSSQ